MDLGDRTLLPGLIDAHVHLFLHPGAEDLQTIEESVAQRVIEAEIAAKADLLAGFTAERDMGTEGAGSASTAVRNAIDAGLIPGPRMRMSGNAIDILGGHEDAVGYNPAANVPSNADYADSADELVKVMRQQRKEGADFAKIYETGKDSLKDGVFTTPYQYSEAELHAAVVEAARLGAGSAHAVGVGVHCTGEPGAGFAVAAGVASVDHAFYLSDKTMAEMKAKEIYAVPTFAIMEYFGEHPQAAEGGARAKALLEFHAAQFECGAGAGASGDCFRWGCDGVVAAAAGYPGGGAADRGEECGDWAAFGGLLPETGVAGGYWVFFVRCVAVIFDCILYGDRGACTTMETI